MFPVILAKIISVILSAFMFITTPVNLLMGKSTKEIARKEDGCILSFAAISDTHIDEKTPFISQTMLEMGLADMDKAKDRLDALVFTGDITNHGYIEQWDIFASTMAEHDAADNVFMVTGNHDTWGPNREDFTNPVDGVLTTFTKYNKIVSDRDIDNMYYSDVVNGCYFICLGSEADHTCATVSDAQLEWLRGELDKASRTSYPVFVFFHQPINGTHGLPYSWELDEEDPPEEGGIGPESDKVVEILKDYDNVIYVSGHIHSGFKTEDDKLGVEYASVEYLENNRGNKITLVNLPSFTNPDVTRMSHLVSGCGYVFEVYEDHVLIRARNFGAGTWVTKYDVTVPVVPVMR
ncbi:MAG: metallophosphoesterase [Clostridia bacterium]|nr:metallophosphoesterase [Clostridia bacterium]